MSKEQVQYQLIRCKRKSTALYVKNTGEVVVRAPYFVSSALVEAFVQSHKEWVLQKQAEQLRQQKKKEAFSLTDHDKLTVLGKEYPIVYGDLAHFNGEVFIIPKASFDQVKKDIIFEYKRIAKQVILERVDYYSQLTGWKAEAVKIGSAKTRWGSCSGKNILNFTWKLIFADLYTIDYVVLHELAHTKEHNHSHRFWDLVIQYMPDYKLARKNLYHIQQKLNLENWD